MDEGRRYSWSLGRVRVRFTPGIQFTKGGAKQRQNVKPTQLKYNSAL